jgi:hypothetical protein
MLPEWIVKILESMGIAGAIIFVLLTTVIGLVAYVRSMQAKADKVYGYRLQERDTLNKVVSDTAKVLADMLEATEDRNDLTEEQAKLIEKQSQAFELLKITILAQYDNIRDHNSATASAVSAMAEAIRTLTMMITENRQLAVGHVQGVQQELARQGEEMRRAIRESGDALTKEIRTLLGNVTRIEHRRKKALT